MWYSGKSNGRHCRNQMPAKNHLSTEQVKALQGALKNEENRDIRERILILMLFDDGKTQAKIAEFIGCSVNKVSYWCIHGGTDNLESLKDDRMKGNHRKVTDKYIEILLLTVEKEPQELGYQFGRWTGQRLAIYLEEITGMKLSGSQIRRILAKKNYVYIWAKHSLESKQDAKKRKAFKKKLARYLKKEKKHPKRLQVWLWDESGFGLKVIQGKKSVKKELAKK